MSPRKRKAKQGGGFSPKKRLSRSRSRSETNIGSQDDGSPARSTETFSPRRRSQRISERLDRLSQESQEEAPSSSQPAKDETVDAKEEEQVPVTEPQDVEMADTESKPVKTDTSDQEVTKETGEISMKVEVETPQNVEEREPENDDEPKEEHSSQEADSSRGLLTQKEKVEEQPPESMDTADSESPEQPKEINNNISEETASSATPADVEEEKSKSCDTESTDAEDATMETNKLPELPVTDETYKRGSGSYYQPVCIAVDTSDNDATPDLENEDETKKTEDMPEMSESPSASNPDKISPTQPFLTGFANPAFGIGLGEEFPLSQIPRNPPLSQPPVTELSPSETTNEMGEPGIVGTDGDWQLVGVRSSDNSLVPGNLKTPFESYKKSFAKDFVHAATSTKEECLAEGDKDKVKNINCNQGETDENNKSPELQETKKQQEKVTNEDDMNGEISDSQLYSIGEQQNSTSPTEGGIAATQHCHLVPNPVSQP